MAVTVDKAKALRAELGPRISAAVDLLERARDRADRNAAMSAKLSRQEIRGLLALVRRLEQELFG